MRELKFRAWDEQHKIMHYDFQFIKSGDEGNDWIVFRSDEQDTPINECIVNPYFRQQLKIMQYTGLKDKAGKEIYEGDIVLFNYDPIDKATTGRDVKYKIEYVEAMFQTICIDGLDNQYDSLNDYVLTTHDIKQFSGEVIGNIHENPELLDKP